MLPNERAVMPAPTNDTVPALRRTSGRCGHRPLRKVHRRHPVGNAYMRSASAHSRRASRGVHDRPTGRCPEKTKKNRRQKFALFTEFCGIRKRPLVCHCERLLGARQSVLLLVHLCTTGVTDRRDASRLAMTPLFTDI